MEAHGQPGGQVQVPVPPVPTAIGIEAQKRGAKQSLSKLFPQLSDEQYEEALNDVMKRQPNGTLDAIVDNCVEYFYSKEVPGLDADPQPQLQAPPLHRTQIIERVLEIFPKADPEWVYHKVEKEHMGLEALTERMFNPQKTYPKVDTKRKVGEKDSATACNAEKKFRLGQYGGYFVVGGRQSRVTDEYREQAVNGLCSDFPNVHKVSLRALFKTYNDSYANTHVGLTNAFYAAKQLGSHSPSFNPRIVLPSQADVKDGIAMQTMPIVVRFTSGKGAKAKCLPPPDLAEEMEWVKSRNEKNEEPEEKMECGVCMAEVRIHDCVYCEMGHTFCAECVAEGGREAAFGQGKMELSCLQCNAPFPKEHLEEILDDKVLEKMDETRAEFNLHKAEIPNLERRWCGCCRCKYCSWAAVVEVEVSVDKVFRCENCGEGQCRECGLRWDENHMGVPCAEMESDTRATARIE